MHKGKAGAKAGLYASLHRGLGDRAGLRRR